MVAPSHANTPRGAYAGGKVVSVTTTNAATTLAYNVPNPSNGGVPFYYWEFNSSDPGFRAETNNGTFPDARTIDFKLHGEGNSTYPRSVIVVGTIDANAATFGNNTGAIGTAEIRNTSATEGTSATYGASNGSNGHEAKPFSFTAWMDEGEDVSLSLDVTTYLQCPPY